MTIQCGSNTLRVVESVKDIPSNYWIWNIGQNMIDGYLPFCRLSDHQPFPGGMSIDTDALLCLPCENAQVVLHAVGYGLQTIPEMRRYIAKYERRRPDVCNRIEQAISVLQEIGWRP